MRKNILFIVLTSLLMLLCIPANAQQNNMDSLLRRLEEFSKETGVKVERIEKGHDYVDLGLSDSTVSLTQLTADMIANVKAYVPGPMKIAKNEYIIEVGSLSKKSKSKNDPNKDKTSRVPVGTTVKELLSQLPGVVYDKDGKIITKTRNAEITDIVFDHTIVYSQPLLRLVPPLNNRYSDTLV